MRAGGSHFYLQYLGSVETEAAAEEVAGIERDQAQAVDDDGLITLDRDSINQNPASKFVPVVPEHVAQTDFVPSRGNIPSPLVTSKGDDHAINAEAAPSDNPVRSEQKPPSRFRSNDHPNVAESNDIPEKSEFGKRDLMLSWIEKRGMKALISRGKFPRQEHLNDQYSFSKVVGETTVYGMTFVTDDLVRGFDFVKSNENATLEIVSPLSGKPQFDDSQFAKQENSLLVGVNIHRQNVGIIGLQAIYADVDGQQTTGNWIGVVPAENEFITVRSAADQTVSGFVLYRHGLRTVGIGLVLSRN